MPADKRNVRIFQREFGIVQQFLHRSFNDIDPEFFTGDGGSVQIHQQYFRLGRKDRFFIGINYGKPQFAFYVAEVAAIAGDKFRLSVLRGVNPLDAVEAFFIEPVAADRKFVHFSEIAFHSSVSFFGTEPEKAAVPVILTL